MHSFALFDSEIKKEPFQSSFFFIKTLSEYSDNRIVKPVS